MKKQVRFSHTDNDQDWEAKWLVLKIFVMCGVVWTEKVEIHIGAGAKYYYNGYGDE